MKRPVVVIIMFILITFVYALQEITFTINTPFNITFNNASNDTKYLSVPLEGYINNVTIVLTGYSAGSYVETVLNDTPVVAALDGWEQDGGKEVFDNIQLVSSTDRENLNNVFAHLPAQATANYTTYNGENNITIEILNYTGGSTFVLLNYSLPLNCYKGRDHISMRAESWADGSPLYGRANYSCYNGTTYESFYYLATTATTWPASMSFLMYKEYDGFPKDINVYLDEQLNYNMTGTFNDSQQITLNATKINNLLNDGCTCDNCTINGDFCEIPIRIQTDRGGILEVNLTTGEYSKQIFLINERTAQPFNVFNVTTARLYYDDNNSFFDFQDQATNVTNITLVDNKLRIYLEYDSGAIINRYIDTDLTDKDVRVCANIEGVTHYEQIIISATEQEAKLKSVYADCLVAADYTRFAYQDSKSLKAFTIDTQYYLYTWSDSVQSILASIDGSIQTYINLDTLEFQARGYNIDLTDSSVGFDRLDNTTIHIYYNNDADDNTDLTLTITNMATGSVVYTETGFTDPDEVNLYFNYATLSDINSTTLFKLDIAEEKSDGTIEEYKRYFTTNARSGVFSNGFALAIAIFFLISGLTLTVSRLAFSWFGILITLSSIIFLSLAAGAWYITFFQAICIVALIYEVIILTMANYPTVAT